MTPPSLKTFQRELQGAKWGSALELFKSLGQGNEPIAVMLTCGELGSIPDQVAHAHEGEVIVAQNLAGIIPRAGRGNPGSSVATVFYALGIPTVRHVIVCGHRQCRVVPELLSDRRPELFTDFREIISEIREDLLQAEENLSRAQLRELAVQKVTLQQLRHLWSYPEIRRRLEDNVLLHGWMYDEETAIAHQFEPRTGRFCRYSPSTASDHVTRQP